MRIGDMLVKAGLIDEMQLSAALAQQRQWGGKLGDILVDQGFLDEMMLWLGISKQLDIPLVALTDLVIPPDVLPLINRDTCEKLDIFPLLRDERTLTVATSDPNNIGALDEVAFRTGLKVKTVLAPAREVTWAIRTYYYGDRAPCPPPKLRRNLNNQQQPSPPPMEIVSGAATTPGAQHQLNRASTPLAEVAFSPPRTPGFGQVPRTSPGGFNNVPGSGAHSMTPSAASPAFNPTMGMAPPAGFGQQQQMQPMPSLEEQLRQANEMLVTLVELCVQRGLFTREELWARMNQRR
jgi:hypothetical protein